MLEYGLLFCIAFAAATVLPLGSEAYTAGLIHHKYSLYWVVFVASSGNTLGAVANWWIGSRFRNGKLTQTYLQKHHLQARQTKKAVQLFNRYGQWSVLLSWLPIIGDAITVAAGYARMPLLRFTLLAAVGKSTRYWVLCLSWQAMM